MAAKICGSESLSGQSEHNDVFQVHCGRFRTLILDEGATTERSVAISYGISPAQNVSVTIRLSLHRTKRFHGMFFYTIGTPGPDHVAYEYYVFSSTTPSAMPGDFCYCIPTLILRQGTLCSSAGLLIVRLQILEAFHVM